MPKPSSNPDKARSGSGSKVEAGIYEVTGAKYQNIKTDYKDNQLYLVLDTAVCDKDGDRVKGADVVEMQFSFGVKSHEAFTPGQALGPQDDSPKDMSTDIDAEGNTVYCSGAEQFNKSCGAIVFAETLVKAGFPKELLDQTYAPNFVGMKFELDSLDAKTVNEKYGTRLNTKPFKDKDGNDQSVTYKVCKRWLNPDYISGAGRKAGAGKAVSSSASGETKSGGKGDWANKSDEQLAQLCIDAVAESRQGDKGAVKTHTQLVGLVTNHYTAKAKMPADRLKAVQAVVKDTAWALKAVKKAGGVIGDEPKYIVFTAAAPAAGDEADQEFDEDGNPV